jgi:hypothetical protein
MGEDQRVRAGLFRAISTGAAARDFEALKETYPVLAGWSSPIELAQHLTSPGRVFARKILLNVLVRAAQFRASASRVAIDILWLVFGPTLLELAAHYCRLDREELPEVLAVVYERFASAVRNVRAVTGSVLFGEVLERTTIDVRAHLEHDRRRQIREVYCDPHQLAQVDAAHAPWDEERLGHLYAILRPHIGEDVNVLFAIAVFGLTFTDVARCIRLGRGSIRRRFNSSCWRARRLLSSDGYAAVAAVQGVELSGVLAVQRRSAAAAGSSKGSAGSTGPSDPSRAPGGSRELQFTVEVVVPHSSAAATRSRIVRYCNVCRRWGGLRSTHLCNVNWFENLEDLLAALEKGEPQ